MNFIVEACRNLKSGADISVKDNDINQITWINIDGTDRPTTAEIQKEVDRLDADFKAKQYQRDRQYPELGEQFDLLFKDIDAGKVDKTGGFFKALKAVKDAHPKG